MAASIIMDRVNSGTPAKHLTLFFTIEFVLLIGFIGSLFLFKSASSTDSSASVRQALYASHELAYEANYLSLMLTDLHSDELGDTLSIRSSFEKQAKRLMQALLDNEGWLTPQNQATHLIRTERQQVENTLVKSLNAGRKLLAIRQSLEQLKSDGQQKELIGLMRTRFNEHRDIHSKLALQNQRAFRNFIRQLEMLHKAQLAKDEQKNRNFINFAILASVFFTLCQLSLCLIYRRHFKHLDRFLTRIESRVQTGFKGEQGSTFEQRLDALANNVQQALDLQVTELQKQRWKNEALEAAGEAILIADQSGHIQYTNAAFTRITGYESSIVLGQNCNILSSGLTSPETYNDLWTGLNQNGYWHGELINQRKTGEIFTQMTTMSALYDEDEHTGARSHQGYIAVMRDISLRKQLERDLYTLARQDGLTGLLNRKTVLDEAEKLLQRSVRYGDPLSVVVLDIDHFKAINDRWGHPTGDKAIVQVADRCREVLPSDGLIGRIGGEEFLMVLPGVNSGKAFKLAEELRLLIASTELLSDQQEMIRLTCSFGISLFSRGYVNGAGTSDLLSKVIAQADNALYSAKREGRNCVRLYSEEEAEKEVF
ncbi:sensor domain-containing diguanylate cyclase [Oceanospirillum sanctuarii]|uniref:sensor domain-containing diguanylate cyclase n=1 Tax=Oceanospirillum sanctuarii TaxID=1434821 RepID=UPI000A3C2B6C|nr:GGDEF domain-containing protein [Oceanospirillum sanctuarii]